MKKGKGFASMRAFDRLNEEFQALYKEIKTTTPHLTDDEIRRDSRMVHIGESLVRLRRKHWNACVGRPMRKKG